MNVDFPDVEDAVMTLVEDWFGADVGTRVPADIQQHLQAGGVFVRVTLTPGGRDNGVSDRSVLDIDTFTATRAAGYDLSEGIRTRLLRGPHRVGDVVLDKVVTVTKPFPADWEDDAIRRRIATYSISARR